MQDKCDSGGDWFHCVYNQTGDAWIQRVDTYGTFDYVCVPSSHWVQRRSEYRTWWSWTTYGTFTVLSGTTDYVELVDFWADFDYMSAIFDVWPDTYHWAAIGLR